MHACISCHNNADDILAASAAFPGRFPKQMIHCFPCTAAQDLCTVFQRIAASRNHIRAIFFLRIQHAPDRQTSPGQTVHQIYHDGGGTQIHRCQQRLFYILQYFRIHIRNLRFLHICSLPLKHDFLLCPIQPRKEPLPFFAPHLVPPVTETAILQKFL